MTTSDPRQRGLEPAHVLGVVNEVAGGAPKDAARAVAIAGCLRVHVASRRHAERATTALKAVGYQTARIKGGGRREVLVTGWNPAALESRLSAMRSILQQLDASRMVTAAFAIDRVRDHPARLPVPTDAAVLAEASEDLRGWVTACTGIRAPHDPTVLPDDLGTALRLRAVRSLETTIDDSIERHLRIAKHALTLFGALRLHATDDRAQEAAIRRADATARLNGSPPRNPSVRRPGDGRPPGPRPGPPFPRPNAVDAASPGPGRLVGRDFPRSIQDAISSASANSERSARAGGRHFPAARLRPRR